MRSVMHIVYISFILSPFRNKPIFYSEKGWPYIFFDDEVCLKSGLRQWWGLFFGLCKCLGSSFDLLGCQNWGPSASQTAGPVSYFDARSVSAFSYVRGSGSCSGSRSGRSLPDDFFKTYFCMCYQIFETLFRHKYCTVFAYPRTSKNILPWRNIGKKCNLKRKIISETLFF